MLNEQTLQTLNALRLFGMARSFGDKIAHPSSADLSHQEFFGLIVQDEKTYRDNLRLKRLLLNAKLPQPACLEDIDYKHPRGLNKQTILELSSTDWFTRHHSVLLTGPTGVAKVISPVRWATSLRATVTPCSICALHVYSKCSFRPKPMDRISKCSPAWPRSNCFSSMICF